MTTFKPNRDIDGNGNTNAVRAGRAEVAVKAYATTAGYRDENDESCPQDMLCDLMHYCDREKIDFSKLQADAHSCYIEER